MIKVIKKNYHYEMTMEDFKKKTGLPQCGSIMDDNPILQCINIDTMQNERDILTITYTWDTIDIQTLEEGKIPYELLCEKEKEIQDYYKENPALIETTDGGINYSINYSKDKELKEIRSIKKTIRDKALQILIEKELGQ